MTPGTPHRAITGAIVTPNMSQYDLAGAIAEIIIWLYILEKYMYRYLPWLM